MVAIEDGPSTHVALHGHDIYAFRLGLSAKLIDLNGFLVYDGTWPWTWHFTTHFTTHYRCRSIS